jgi:DNA-binding NarL/FixJ family response regulator
MIKVLLVDDDEMVRYALRSAFQIADIVVVEKSNGSFVRTPGILEDVDVVVTDILMPNVEGIELITTLNEVAPHIPVIAMSGGGRLNSQDYLTSASDLGAAAVFSKPLDEVKLVDKVRELAALKH